MTTFSVDNLNDSGLGSLRAAISGANNDSGSPTVIDFLVSGTITLTTGDLPAITNKMTIDGDASGGAPKVELDCNGNGGLVFASGSEGSKLLGLAIGNASGNGVTLDAGSITLDGNYIGVDLTGAAAIANGGDGIFVASTSSNNVIGLNPPTALNTAPAGVVSNVISGNAGNGISFNGSSGNTLVANRIGTDASGTAALGNGGNGIWLTGGASGNEIGGTAFIDSTTGDVNDPTGNKGTVTPVFVVPPQGNLVSGNGQNGVLIDSGSQHNTLNGNFIGTDASGNTAIGNTLDGVAINSADNNSLVGCQFVNNPFVYYNVVSGNGGNGLHVTDSNDTTVQGNFFGSAANNAAVLGNTLDGILVDGTSDTTIVGGVIPLGNVSAGNGQNGIEVKDSASNFITFNTFGGLFAFGGAAPNGNDGLLITSTGANNSVQTNVFSGNLNNGIEIGGNASGVVVEPNIAGLNTVGSAPLPNGNDGLLIDGTAHDIVVGGTIASVIPQNTFSGNLGYGIAMMAQSYDNQVFDARVGTNVEGTTALGNQAGGILIGDTSHGDTIGGSGANMISGNIGNGVTLAAGTDSIQVTNNTIGFDRGGNLLPNTVAQLVVDPGSTNDTISGNQIACFATGTRIATRRGEVAVEMLRVGTPVRCLLGNRWEKLIWIGHREIDCRRHPDPRSVHPVRIAAHAFGPGRPARDLLLSPDHGVYVNEVLIPVKYLINRRSIRQIAVKRITYYHVELPVHTVLLAEGLPTESYLDLGDRANFANADVTRLFVAFADVAGAREAKACAPLVVSGPEFEAARKLASSSQRALRHTG